MKLFNGEKLVFIIVGGRISCYVFGVQKKIGVVLVGVKVEMVEDGLDSVLVKKKGRKKVDEEEF